MTEVVAPAVAGIAVGLFLVNILEDSYESDKCALDLEKLTSSGEKWTIYCCTTSKYRWKKLASPIYRVLQTNGKVSYRLTNSIFINIQGVPKRSLR